MIDISISGEKAKYFKTIIDVLQSVVVGPRKFSFNPDNGLIMASMEESAAVFVMFRINKPFFSSYNVESETSLGLSLDDLKKVFSRSIKDNATINMKYTSDSNKFEITFEDGLSKVEYKLNVHVPEVDNSDTISKVKAIPLDSEITFEGGGNLKNILSDVGIVAQKDLRHLAVKIENRNELVFELKGDATGIYAKSVLKKGDGSPIHEIKSDSERVESLYDMENLEKLFKIDAMADKSVMELSSDNPLRITFSLADDNIEFVYLVAPLDTEEEEDF
ncbi:MAG: DNA polymerase sliding clamp 1 [Candidatus Heimdallarchaeota archaeon LC_3]|nr:MAG: DNA polymerase sliding clamp 1 [Candidatus Heimdallarchaeota archaeon LC_3]